MNGELSPLTRSVLHRLLKPANEAFRMFPGNVAASRRLEGSPSGSTLSVRTDYRGAGDGSNDAQNAPEAAGTPGDRSCWVSFDEPVIRSQTPQAAWFCNQLPSGASLRRSKPRSPPTSSGPECRPTIQSLEASISPMWQGWLVRPSAGSASSRRPRLPFNQFRWYCSSKERF